MVFKVQLVAIQNEVTVNPVPAPEQLVVSPKPPVVAIRTSQVELSLARWMLMARVVPAAAFAAV
jgi:hypothetical protein